ncbi:TerD family protein, partial [Streptomyces sp. TRM76130]|nr:TerD family protein [Streptomyces sp. TRM76130]
MGGRSYAWLGNLQRGHKAGISDLTAGTDLYVGVRISGPGLTFDISCFELDADERLSDDRYKVARFPFDGSEFSTERAVMLGDLHLADGWRFAAVGQGFDGGLDALLRNFGGEVAEEETPEPEPAAGAVPQFAPPAEPVPAPEPPAFGVPAAPEPAPVPVQVPVAAPAAQPAARDATPPPVPAPP